MKNTEAFGWGIFTGFLLTLIILERTLETRVTYWKTSYCEVIHLAPQSCKTLLTKTDSLHNVYN